MNDNTPNGDGQTDRKFANTLRALPHSIGRASARDRRA